MEIGRDPKGSPFFVGNQKHASLTKTRFAHENTKNNF